MISAVAKADVATLGTGFAKADVAAVGTGFGKTDVADALADALADGRAMVEILVLRVGELSQ